jgi:multiple sugar transport system permease protein
VSGSATYTWLSRLGGIVLLLLYGTPLLWLVTTSFKSNTDAFRGLQTLIVFTPTFAAYQRLLTQGLVQSAINSVQIALGATLVTLLFAVPAAYALARARTTLVSLGLGIVIVLQMMPQTATVIPLYKVLGAWNLLGSTVGVILADAALLIPFSVLLLRPFFRAVPIEIEEAGTVDGASIWRVFGQIALPLAANGVATAATIIFLIAWGEFLYAISFLVDPNNYPLSVLIASQIGQYGNNWPALMAVGVAASLPILVIFLATYRLLQQGLAMGSIK